MGERWLTADELAVWLKLLAVVELLPGVLDAQLKGDANLSIFEYQVLAMLSESPDRTRRMTALAQRTNATLPRLSHVVARLEDRGFIARTTCPQDRRATNATLTDAGWEHLVASAPGHVDQARSAVIDALTAEQLTQLGAIADAILTRIDPDGRMTVTPEQLAGAAAS